MGMCGHQCKTTKLDPVWCTASSKDGWFLSRSTYTDLYTPCLIEEWAATKKKIIWADYRRVIVSLCLCISFCQTLLPSTPHRPHSVDSDGSANLRVCTSQTTRLFQLLSYLLWARKYEQANVRKYICCCWGFQLSRCNSALFLPSPSVLERCSWCSILSDVLTCRSDKPRWHRIWIHNKMASPSSGKAPCQSLPAWHGKEHRWYRISIL